MIDKSSVCMGTFFKLKRKKKIVVFKFEGSWMWVSKVFVCKDEVRGLIFLKRYIFKIILVI